MKVSVEMDTNGAMFGLLQLMESVDKDTRASIVAFAMDAETKEKGGMVHRDALIKAAIKE